MTKEKPLIEIIKEDIIALQKIENDKEAKGIIGYANKVLFELNQKVEELKEEVEESQYDYANLEHVMKDKVIELIDKIFGDFNQSQEGEKE